MSGQGSFFSCIKHHWGAYDEVRNQYSHAIPLPQRSYFSPINSINVLSTTAVRVIEKPVWLAFHCLGFLIKSVVHLALSIALALPVVLMTLIAPKSDIGDRANSLFKWVAAQTLVSAGMAGIALISTALALLFNPLFLVSRAAATLIDRANLLTESCCNLTIAKL